MTALAELQAGAPARDFLSLLARTIRAVATAGNFPAPEGHRTWDGDAVTSAVAGFLASPQTPRRLTDLSVHCQTEDAVRVRLQRTVRNYLADLGRRTPVGRLVLRFNEVLSTDPLFELAGGYWSFAGLNAVAAGVDQDALVAAMSGVDVVVPTAWATGDRQGPDVDADSVTLLAKSALTAAGGALRASDMAKAAARRLGLGGASLSLESTGFDPPAPSPMSGDATGDPVLVDIRVDEVCFERLNDHERTAIGLVEVPVAKLGPILGVSGSKAALIRKRAVAILRDELLDEEGGQAIADAVIDRARTWAESWMI